MDTGRLEACEALVRWRHPARGVLSPALFIAVAESTGAIHELGEWILQTACAEAATWPDSICVAVNVSPHQVSDRSIVRVVEAALRRSGLPARRLHIEITESALLGGDDGVAALAELSDLGVALVLDDFGTGFSSFDHIRRLPIRGLKIDRSFVAALPFDLKSGAIVKAVDLLAHSLDLWVIAEGVESEAQLEFLRRTRCVMGQGYLFHRPLQGAALRRLIAASRPIARQVA